MSRRKLDVVDVAFRAWAQLDTEGKQRLADRVAGYQEAMGVVAAPAPRVRQRKAKVPWSADRIPISVDSTPKTA